MSENPTVGRIVHYRSRGSADGVFPPQCRAAIVTEVYASSSPAAGLPIALAVLNPTGLFFDRTICNDADGAPGTWHWYTECPDGKGKG